MSKVAVYSQYTDTRANGTTVFYRTGKGDMRHASSFCANSKRSIFTGDITVIPQDEAASWQPCADCCTEADIVEARATAEAKQAGLCPNSGITHAGRGRIYDTCKDCGKDGKVNRQTGRIRAHKPLTAAAPAEAPAAPRTFGSLSWTLGELRGFAKEFGIAGRSKMTGEQLLEALAAHGIA